jgi:hypothetical protein
VRNRGTCKLAPLSPDWLRPIYAGIYKQAKKHAGGRHAKKGIAFTLTIEEFNTLVARCENRCELSQRAFEDTANLQAFQRHPHYPSLDRIDATGPYSFANCRIVTVSINMALGTWGEDVLMENAVALVAALRQAAATRRAAAPLI